MIKGPATDSLKYRLVDSAKTEESSQTTAKLQWLRGRLFFRRSRSGCGVSTFRHRGRCGGSSFRSTAGRITGWSSGLASGATFRATVSTTGGLAAVDHFVATGFQCFFRFVTDTAIAVSQCMCQCFDNFVSHAAAAVAANLIADFISRFVTNSLIAIVQSVDECTHDLWIAAAVVTITQTIDCSGTVLCVARRL